MENRIQLRKDTAANWTSNNPVLALGEPGYETDTAKIKMGDGVTAWTSLGYVVDNSPEIITVAGTTYTLTEANFGAYTRFTSATPVTVTVPVDLVPLYNVATFRQAGAGAVTFEAAVGVTINGELAMAGEGNNLQLIKIADNVYDELGGITP